MKKLTIIVIILTTFLTSGCFLKEKDLGKMLFPISIGLSYEENKYKIYLQVLNTSALSIVETETSQTDTTYILIHAEDENLNEALTKLGLKALTYISAIKVKSIVLHTSIFKESPLDYHTIAQFFINSPLFRSKVQLFTTSTKLEDFYSVQYSLVGSTVYSHTNEEEPVIIRGYTKPSFLIDSLKSYAENKRSYHFPTMDVSEENIDSGDQTGKLEKTKTYKYTGICFTTYNEEKKYDCLTKEEALGYKWYSEQTYINVELGNKDNPINIIVDKSNWKTTIKDNKFNINLKIKAIINFNLSNYSIKKIKEEINNKIKKDILDTLNVSYIKNIDIYHLNDYSLRKNKDLKYNPNNVIVNIDANIINSSYYKY